MAMFLDYARSHSEEWHLPAGAVLYAAIYRAFACKRGAKEPTP
jgi:hypothetical protein